MAIAVALRAIVEKTTLFGLAPIPDGNDLARPEVQRTSPTQAKSVSQKKQAMTSGSATPDFTA